MLLRVLLLLLLGTARTSSSPNLNLKILSFYDTVYEDQKSLLTLAIAENALANQFRTVGVPSLAPLDNIAAGVYKRRPVADGGSVLLPGWEKLVESWVGHLQPSLDNGTTAGVFLGDEICCHISVSCWEGLLNPLASKFRSLLGPTKIIYVNECGDAIAGRNCSCDPHSSPACGGCDSGHPGQPPLIQISPALSHVSVDLYAGYGPHSSHFNGSAEVARLRPFVEREIYPRMAPGQLFVTVPGTFACSDLHWAPLDRSDMEVAQKMEEYFAWAKEDDRVAGFNPWHWNFRHAPQATGPCDMRLGAVNMSKTRAVLRRISNYIKARGPKTDDVDEFTGSPSTTTGIRLDRASLGRRFDGMGAIFDASVRMVFDYPEPQRSEILDYWFKPGFGAALSIVKVEVGGDAQQTDGTTASYRHTKDEPPNFERSYIWWLLKEAKRRHPSVLVYGLAWGFPGWLQSFYSTATAEYLAGWAVGARMHHGIDIDVLGLWNERAPCRSQGRAANGSLVPQWNGTLFDCSVVSQLRSSLDRSGLNATKIAATDGVPGIWFFEMPKNIVGDQFQAIIDTKAPIDIVATHGPQSLSGSQEAHAESEGWQHWESEMEYPYTGAARMAQALVRDYIESNVTAQIVWPAARGFYPALPYGWRGMFMETHAPWCGHYIVPSTVWVFAHLNQHVEPGWHYLAQGDGAGFLPGGGSFMSLSSADRTQLTVLIETATNVSKWMDCNPACAIPGTMQMLQISLPSTVRIDSKRLEVWMSNLSTAFIAAQSYADPVLTSSDGSNFFLRQPDLEVETKGTERSVTVNVPAGSLLTVTTRRGKAAKGRHPEPPALEPFPLPYSVDYTKLTRGQQGPYLSDQQGVFEIASVGEICSSCREQPLALIQTVTEPPIGWVWATPRPLTLFGDPAWNNVSVEAEMLILSASRYTHTVPLNCKRSPNEHVGFYKPGGTEIRENLVGGTFASIGVRVIIGGALCGAGHGLKGGYFLLVYANHTFAVTKTASWPSNGGEIVLAEGSLPPLSAMHKRRLQLTAVGDVITAYVDGKRVASVEDRDHSHGFAAIASGWHRIAVFKASVSDVQPIAVQRARGPTAQG